MAPAARARVEPVAAQARAAQEDKAAEEPAVVPVPQAPAAGSWMPAFRMPALPTLGRLSMQPPTRVQVTAVPPTRRRTLPVTAAVVTPAPATDPVT
jgi:hypothetical protein